MTKQKSVIVFICMLDEPIYLFSVLGVLVHPCHLPFVKSLAVHVDAVVGTELSKLISFLGV